MVSWSVSLRITYWKMRWSFRPANVLLRNTINYILSLYHCRSASHVSLCHTIRTSSNLHYIHIEGAGDLSRCLSYEVESALQSGVNFLLLFVLSSYSEQLIESLNRAFSCSNSSVVLSLSDVIFSYQYFNVQVFRYRLIFNNNLSNSLIRSLLPDARLLISRRKFMFDSQLPNILDATEDEAYGKLSDAHIILYCHNKKLILAYCFPPYIIFCGKLIHKSKVTVQRILTRIRSRFR